VASAEPPGRPPAARFASTASAGGILGDRVPSGAQTRAPRGRRFEQESSWPSRTDRLTERGRNQPTPGDRPHHQQHRGRTGSPASAPQVRETVRARRTAQQPGQRVTGWFGISEPSTASQGRRQQYSARVEKPSTDQPALCAAERPLRTGPETFHNGRTRLAPPAANPARRANAGSGPLLRRRIARPPCCETTWIGAA